MADLRAMPLAWTDGPQSLRREVANPCRAAVAAELAVDDMSEWYFAYGSNLWIEQMVERAGPIRQGDDRPRVARLASYRLVFNMAGDRGQVFANIVCPGEGVVGVIYGCGPNTLDKLDTYEGGYERRRVAVVAENGEKVDAVTYVAKPTNLANGRKPSAAYLHRIVTGARQHGLPEVYIREIETMGRGDP
jgi:gamma-glutamylcyclotransferase